MPTSRKKLKLGKRAAFVKSRLCRVPQEDDVWEADFQPIPNEEQVEFWHETTEGYRERQPLTVTVPED